jgi:hypothetical protein
LFAETPDQAVDRPECDEACDQRGNTRGYVGERVRQKRDLREVVQRFDRMGVTGRGGKEILRSGDVPFQKDLSRE